jgi:hypothetical protein
VLNLLAVALVDAGIAGMFAGLLSLLVPLRFLHIATRMAGAAIFLAAFAVAIVGLLVPAALEHVQDARTDLDRAVPAYQFRERHRTHVNAAPDVTYRAMRAVTADDITLFRTLTWIRSPRLRQADGGTILRPPSVAVPLLDVALRTTFRQVSERPPRELVVATTVGRGVNATMNFLIEPATGGASELSTETRVVADTPAATRRFGAYWHTIYPGSSLIRFMWLRAIKTRAERGQPCC